MDKPKRKSASDLSTRRIAQLKRAFKWSIIALMGSAIATVIVTRTIQALERVLSFDNILMGILLVIWGLLWVAMRISAMVFAAISIFWLFERVIQWIKHPEKAKRKR